DAAAGGRGDDGGAVGVGMEGGGLAPCEVLVPHVEEEMVVPLAVDAEVGEVLGVPADGIDGAGDAAGLEPGLGGGGGIEVLDDGEEGVARGGREVAEAMGRAASASAADGGGGGAGELEGVVDGEVLEGAAGEIGDFGADIDVAGGVDGV